MIESIMYFGIGFLIATLIGLMIMPFVHSRAVRLTVRRIDAATPLSMAEVQADKDQLRAEFAMSTRRLEMSLEQLNAKNAAQLAELGKKGDAINRLMIELNEKAATNLALEAREKETQDHLRKFEQEIATKGQDLFETQRLLSEKEPELVKVSADLEEQMTLAESHKIEIIALKARVEALNEGLQDAERELKEVETRRDTERVELKAATQELLEARNKTANFARRIEELEQALTSQIAEAKSLDQRSEELEKRLHEQASLFADSEVERKLLRNDLKNAQNIEAELRAAIATLESNSSAASEKLTAENIQLRTDLIRMEGERGHLAHELSGLKRKAEENWAAEQQENAFLRERINDVAVNVARLASNLEGSDSPLQSLLAMGNTRERTDASTSVAAPDLTTAAKSQDDLAERMRASQTPAPRVRSNLKASK